jgi:hypothetical protein
MNLVQFTEQGMLDYQERMRKEQAGLVFDVDGVTLRWRYEYFIEWGRLRTRDDLISWCHHLCGKGWFTPLRMKMFIEGVCNRKGWRMYGAKRRNDRHKLTPALRLSILTRDNFECVLCGNGRADGAKLHVDHIIAVAVGGVTEPANLQTLCALCNTGKGAN